MKSYRHLITVILLMISGFLYSQRLETGTPFIKNITSKEYGYESQNFSIAQDNRGIMYFGNTNGILEYDGSFWRLIDIPGIPRMTFGFDSVMYVGGYNEFGYLTYYGNYKTVFQSLKPSEDFSIGTVQDVFSLNREILFCTEDLLYRWDGEQIKIIDSIEYASSVQQINNLIYYKRKNGALIRYKDFESTAVENSDFINQHIIKDILPYQNNKLLFYFSDIGSFYVFNGEDFIKLNTDIDNYLKKNKLTKGLLLNEGNYIFGTERCGIVMMDEKGNFILHLNKSIGLNDDNISDIYIDHADNLWLTMDNGIARVEYPSVWSYFSEEFGVKGGISSIIKYDGLLYIATTQGVYFTYPYMEVDKNNLCKNHAHFFPIRNISEESNTLFILNNTLLVSTVEGVYIIHKDKAEKIIDGVIESIVTSKKDPTIFFAANNNGVSVLKIHNKSIKLIGTLSNLSADVRTIAEDDQGYLWLGSDYLGVFRVDFTKGINLDAQVLNFKENHGLPLAHGWIDVYSTSNGVYFSTHKGMYKFNYDSLKFYCDTLLGIDFTNNDRWIYPLVEDANKNLWFSSGHNHKYEKQTALAIYNGKGVKYTLITNTFNVLNDITIEAIFPDTNDIVWFGSFDGMIRYDPHVVTQMFAAKTLLRRIVIGEDSIFYMGGIVEVSNDSIYPEFKYQFNNIHFDYSAPDYKSGNQIKYQYYLEGFDENWSEWTQETSRDYTNLSEGTYIFHVRAKDIYGNICKEAVFKFRIKPPIYRTWVAFVLYITLIITFIFMVFRWREYLFAQEKLKLEEVITEKTEEILRQKERAEELLANMLPPDTAKEIQSKGRASRKKYKMVTVLFSDIQGFTKIAEHMNPEKLLDELDKFFLQFDEVVGTMNIEKIKTIGDAYMCAGGIPKKNRTNPIDVVLAGIIMRENMRRLKDESENDWDIRIGIHTGPVIAGVVGSKKLSYDIWGDTVNIASRMESSGQIGEINISETTYELVSEFFDCEPRGKIPVKYKGDIYMYFVKGIKKELSDNGDHVTPNKAFAHKLQFIRFDDLEEVIMHKLEKGLPKNLYYHNLKHTIDVVVEVEIIGLGENVTKDEMLLLKTAALLHDTGFLIGYDNHEDQSIEFAKDILKEFYYDDDQIQIIVGLINATKENITPQTKLEKIIKDADLDYLGRTDYIPVSQNLFRELFEQDKIKSIEEWHKMQIKFIENHVYYTETARKMRNSNKQKHLEQLKQMV